MDLQNETQVDVDTRRLIAEELSATLAQLGQNLKRQRDNLGLSIGSVAEFSDADPSVVRDIETGFASYSILDLMNVAVTLEARLQMHAYDGQSILREKESNTEARIHYMDLRRGSRQTIDAAAYEAVDAKKRAAGDA